MKTSLKVRKADVAGIVERTFPEYRGRKFRIEVTDAVTLFDLNWSGGTRSVYKAIGADGRVGGGPVYEAPWAHPYEGVTVDLPPGTVVVEHSIFCGQNMGLTIYVHPVDMPHLLPAVAA